MDIDATIDRILNTAKTVAIVGATDNRYRPGYYVPAYLRNEGYIIVLIHPTRPELDGRPTYPSLAAVPEPIDVVITYRRAEAIPGVVDEAIAAGVKAVWMPLDVINEEAAATARAAGLDVVMNRCMMVEHKHRHYG